MTLVPQHIQVNFAITGCKIIRFSFSDFANKNKEQFLSDRFSFAFTLNLQIDEYAKQVSVLINSTLQVIDEYKNPKEEIACIDTKNDFKVINLEQFLIKSAEGDLLPDGLIIQLFSISIASLRGIYATKLQETIYENAVLPLMDVAQFIPKKAITIA